MERKHIASSELLSIGYDFATRTLEVEFPTKAVYHYYDVPETVYSQFVQAGSQDDFFAEHIREVYRFRLIQQQWPSQREAGPRRPFTDKEIDILLKLYEQNLLSMRGFIDLRFKHFTTFVAITSLLAAGIVLRVNSQIVDVLLSVFGICLTALFWMLDFRTRNHIVHSSVNAESVMARLPQEVHDLSPYKVHSKNRFLLKASQVTNVLFGLFLAAWLLLLVLSITLGTRSQADAPSTTTVVPVPHIWRKS